MNKQERYNKSMRAKGFVLTHVWVPQSLRERLLKYAARLRKEKPGG